jgi:hypothetical protein
MPARFKAAHISEIPAPVGGEPGAVYAVSAWEKKYFDD